MQSNVSRSSEADEHNFGSLKNTEEPINAKLKYLGALTP